MDRLWPLRYDSLFPKNAFVLLVRPINIKKAAAHRAAAFLIIGNKNLVVDGRIAHTFFDHAIELIDFWKNDDTGSSVFRLFGL